MTSPSVPSTSRSEAEKRAAEAVRTGAEAVVTACPFCLEMFTQGVARVNGHHAVECLDVVELVERALPEPAGCCSEGECAATGSLVGRRPAGSRDEVLKI